MGKDSEELLGKEASKCEMSKSPSITPDTKTPSYNCSEKDAEESIEDLEDPKERGEDSINFKDLEDPKEASDESMSYLEDPSETAETCTEDLEGGLNHTLGETEDDDDDDDDNDFNAEFTSDAI